MLEGLALQFALSMGNYSLALELFDKLPASATSTPQAQQVRASLLLAQPLLYPEEILDIAKRLPRPGCDVIEMGVHSRMGDWNRAYAAALRVLDVDPNHRAARDACKTFLARIDNRLVGVYNPTPPVVARAALDLARLRPGERFCDIGCGDGRVVDIARLRGAQAVGFEIDEDLLAKCRTYYPKCEFRGENVFDVDFSQFDVVFSYMLTEPLTELAPKILAAGARLVTHDTVPNGLQWSEHRVLRGVHGKPLEAAVVFLFGPTSRSA